MSERMTEAKARTYLDSLPKPSISTVDTEKYYAAKCHGYLERVSQENANLTRYQNAHREATERNLDLHFQLQEKQREIEKLRDLNRRAKDVLVMNQECEQVASVGWNRERIKRKELEVALTAERERSGKYRAQLDATLTALRARWADGRKPLSFLVHQIDEVLQENPTGGKQG